MSNASIPVIIEGENEGEEANEKAEMKTLFEGVVYVLCADWMRRRFDVEIRVLVYFCEI